MPTLLIVHHTPSPALQAMFEAAASGARTDEIEGVDVVVRPALTATVPDVLAADGYLLGTPANIGYMSGALKYFFDGIYYPCLEADQARPYGLYVHGNLDTGGAVLRGGVDHDRPGLAAGQARGNRDRHAGQGRPGGVLGTRRARSRPGGRARSPGDRHGDPEPCSGRAL